MIKRSVFLLLIFTIVVSWIMGCAVPQQVTPQLTPEQIAAQQDSIAKVNEKELKKWRMFAFDKIKESNWDKAREYFWKVVELDVKHEYNDWARIYQTFMETDQVDSAQVTLQMGLEYHPEDPFLNATYGFYLKAQGQYDTALEHYRIAIKSNPEEIEYVKKEGEILELLGRGEEAIASYEKVVETNPSDLETKDRLTSLLRQFRDPSEYIKSLEDDIETNPQDINKHLELIIAYVEQDMNDAVIAQVDEMVGLELVDKQAMQYKASAQENLNKLADAIETHKAILELDPDNVETHLSIADDYRLLKKFTTARSWVLKARDKGNNPPAADFIMGQIYESAGDECSGGRGLEYDDKLVYVIAYGLYQKASKGDDYSVKDRASRRLEYLNQFVPAYSDWFMNKTKKMPGDACYKWINASWSESKYINTFLANVEKSKG